MSQTLRSVLVLTGLLSAAVVASAAAGVAMAWIIPPKPGWAMIGFEAALILTGVVGLLFARGKFREAPALTLACLAGAVFVASFLGYYGVQKRLGTFPLWMWLAGRTVIAAGLGLSAVAVALGPSREGKRSLAKGILWAMVPIAVGAWYMAFGLVPLTTPAAGAVEVLRIAGLAVVVVATFVSLCAAVHFTMRAFEIALPPENA